MNIMMNGHLTEYILKTFGTVALEAQDLWVTKFLLVRCIAYFQKVRTFSVRFA